MNATVDVEGQLRALLRSYDRIGFGRRGVLDAEQEIRSLASRLSAADRARLCRIVIAWIEAPVAEKISAALHYNLPEHVQTLAIRLCASLPCPDSLSVLRRLRLERAFGAEHEEACRQALGESLALLEASVASCCGE